MNLFFRHILKSNGVKLSSDSEDPEGSTGGGSQQAGLVFSNPIKVSNNGCYTEYKITVTVPSGPDATITGTVITGNVLNNTFVGSRSIAAGVYTFHVLLANSGITRVGSRYSLQAALASGETRSELFIRSSADSPFYDDEPC